MDGQKGAKAQRIAEVEQRLGVLLGADKQSWVEIYKLMKTVDEETLYEGIYNSYSQWVNALAERNHVHVSLLWRRLKAGRFYDAYESRAKEQGCSVPDLAAAKVSPDNLELIEKISGANTNTADSLIEKTIAHELSRADLKSAWEAVKADRGTVVRKTRHDKADVVVEASAVTASDIMLALADSAWLPNQKPAEAWERSRYKVLPEFAVQTGSTRSVRRIDALAIENLTVPHDKNYNVSFHAIEIKVSKSDLENDRKMLEYTDFADYFWLAVPDDEQLIEAAKDLMLDSWGLLVLHADDTAQKRMEVAIAAKRSEGRMRDKTMAAAIVKLM